jgi:hypothetical protein
MHINFGLFADILRELAATVRRIPPDDVMHRDQLTKAVAELHASVVEFPFGADEVHKMVLAKFMREEGRDFWIWSAENRV